MRITYTEFVPDPKLRGTTVNLPAHVCQVLIAQGSAVAVPYKSYQERLAAEAMPPAPPPEISWGVQDTGASLFSVVCIVKKVGNETFYLKEPPTDGSCPPSIVAKWKSLTDTPTETSASASAQRKLEQQEADRVAKEKTYGVIYAGR